MPHFDPKIAFYIGLVIFVAGIIGTAGPSFFAGALPADVIPPTVKWCAIISTVGNGVLTYIAGQNMTNAGRLANVEQVPIGQKMDHLAENPEVESIVTTQALAETTDSDKVVGPPPATGTKN